MTKEPLVLIEELQIAVEDLWALWTEPDKVAKWLAGGATIDLRVGGMYQLTGHLATRPLQEPVGGPIVGLEEEYVLKVAWRLPSQFGAAVSEAAPPTTLVALFQPLGPNRTRLRLEHEGWREGEEWAAALRWQTEAWTAVLARLKQGDLPG
ncbi:MAG: SRPBCC domain-containing protein [Thermoplasmata archaeon]